MNNRGWIIKLILTLFNMHNIKFLRGWWWKGFQWKGKSIIHMPSLQSILRVTLQSKACNCSSSFSWSQVYFINKTYIGITHLPTQWHWTYSWALCEVWGAHSDGHSCSLSFWCQAQLVTTALCLWGFIRPVIKRLLAKTLSYLHRSVPTTAPWNKLQEEGRKHIKTINYKQLAHKENKI